MEIKVFIIQLKKLKQHESVDGQHLQKLKSKIEKDAVFKEPIIVDKEHLVILDGHHRLNSCKQLGLSRIPCILVDYLKDNNVKVTTRRKEFNINKKVVIEMGLSNKIFPYKTTKHDIPYRIKNLKIPLKELS